MSPCSMLFITVWMVLLDVGCLSGKNRRFQAVSGGRWGVTGTVVVVTTVASYVVIVGGHRSLEHGIEDGPGPGIEDGGEGEVAENCGRVKTSGEAGGGGGGE